MPTLLLADENFTTQRLVALTFAGEETFRVVSVADGQQAIEKVTAQNPDVVLAATSLPLVNGYDVARFVHEKASHVPVLLLCGAFEEIDQSRLRACGASGVIEKPLEPVSVVRRVKELLSVGVTVAPPSLEGSPASGRKDYLGALGDAFDSLDDKLAQGISGPPPTPPVKPAPAPEPASPAAAKADEKPIFEVDQDWFAHENRPHDRPRVERKTGDDAPASGEPAPPVFEVDADWFAEDNRARADRLAEQRQLAAEMGIFDIDLPKTELVPNAAAPVEGLDFDFGLDDLPVPAGSGRRGPDPDSPFATPAAAPPPMTPPETDKSPVLLTPPQPPHDRRMADDFAALLAEEQRDRTPVTPAEPGVPPPASAPRLVKPKASRVNPARTEAALNAIATKVAQRLASGPFADRISDAISAAVRETVKIAVSETSERLVREEIARIKDEASKRQ